MSPATTTDELTIRAVHAWRVLLTHEPGDVTAAAIALDYVQEACDDRAACLAAIRQVAAEEWWVGACEVFTWLAADGKDNGGWLQGVYRWLSDDSDHRRSQIRPHWVDARGLDSSFCGPIRRGELFAKYIDALVSAL